MKTEDSAIFVCCWEHPNDPPGSSAQGILRPHLRPALDHARVWFLLSLSQGGLRTVGLSSSGNCRLFFPPGCSSTRRLLCVFSCSCLIRVDFSTSCSRDAPVSPLPTSCPGFCSCRGRDGCLGATGGCEAGGEMRGPGTRGAGSRFG